jgi:thiol:disulfide interchange protein
MRRIWLVCVGLSGLVAAAEVDVTVAARFDKESYAPGDTVRCALDIAIPPQYHLYGNPLGPGIGKPLKLTAGGEGVAWKSAAKSPASKFQPRTGDWVWAYEKRAIFFLTGVLDSTVSGPVAGSAALDALICHTACVPISKSIDFTIPVDPSGARTAPAWNPALARLFAEAESMPLDNGGASRAGGGQPIDLGMNLSALSSDPAPSASGNRPSGAAIAEASIDWDYDPLENRAEYNFFLAILLAFLAGVILNVMPCVLPVLGIKILSFSQGRGSSRKEALLHSLAFSAGMVLIFLVLASFAAFAGLSWGEQFQTPAMLVTIIALIFFFALGMFDVYTIMVPAGIGSLQQKQARAGGYSGDLFKGMFTTVLATPCSGPLLGATLAWTLRQPPATIYAVFAAIGLGMASPYVILSASKRLAGMIPKPGAWMDDFKHFMGFLLIGFAVYLMVGLPKDMVLSTVALCLAVAFGAGVYGRYAKFGAGWGRKALAAMSAILIVTGGWYASFKVIYPSISEQGAAEKSAESIDWQPFTSSALMQAHARGRHVLVNFTANWCMNCQYNKIRVLRSKKIRNLIEKKQVIALSADLTQENQVAESLLHHLGSRSIPFLAIFPGDQPYRPIIMRDLLSIKRLSRRLGSLPEN